MLQHIVTCRLQGDTSELDRVLRDVDPHYQSYVIGDSHSAHRLLVQFAALHVFGENSSLLSFHTVTLSTHSLTLTLTLTSSLLPPCKRC